MSKSKEAICNLALQRIGVTAYIDSIDQRVKEAMVCNRCYDTVRQKTLSEGRFPFARKYADLALSGTAPYKWKFRYVYPNDCLAIWYLFPNVGEGYDPITIRRIARENKHPFEIVSDEHGEKTICTDVENAIIEYGVDVDNVVRFDSSFESAFAWGIASEIALPLARDIKFSQNAFSMYGSEILKANAAALNESASDEVPESEFVKVRW